MARIRWFRRLRPSRPAPDESAHWEIEHHLEELAERLVAEGWDTEDARREAERRFGDRRRYGASMTRLERRRRSTQRWTRIRDVGTESAASVLRTGRRYPGFTAAVVLTLALGIGANATMYGIVDRIFLRPPGHVVDHEGVRRVLIDRVAWKGSTLGFPDYLDLLEHRGLAGAAAYTAPRELTRGGGPDASRVRAVLATASFFPLLGVQPVLGRAYALDDDRPGAEPTALLGNEYWRRDLGADPGVLGRTLDLRGHTFRVIGVLPPGFTGVDLAPVDVWLPFETTQALLHSGGVEGWLVERNTRGASFFMKAVVRLADGVSVEAVEAEATRLHLNGYREEMASGRHASGASVVLEPLIRARGSEATAESRVARWLLGVSLLVLLIACANVANLLLARGLRRQREVAVRLALGISRPRLVVESVVESVLLALAGGAAALLLARLAGEAVRSVLLPNVLFPRGAMDARVAVYAAAAAVLAGVLAGLAPALEATRTGLFPDLAHGGRGLSTRRSRFRSALTVAQAAMCVVLLVGAGLFVRSVQKVRSFDLGLDVDRLVMARIEWDGELTSREQNALYQEALGRLGNLPGTEGAAVTSVPFGLARGVRLRIPGFDSLPRLPGGGPYFYGVGPGYFRTVGLRLLEGRGFHERDDAGGPRVAVVSRTMAETLWPGEGALGRCLMVGESDGCARVVGVVQDASRYGLNDRDYGQGKFMAYYVPVAQDEDRALRALYVRANGEARRLVASVASNLKGLSPRVRYAEVEALRDRIDPQARSWTLGAALFTAFGLLALLVSAVGLYSVLAFDVAQRTRELGIRTALGARRGRLLGSVLAHGGRLGALGVGLGSAAAYLAAPFARELLFEVSPRDPGVLGSVALVLLAVSVAASLVPGMRATRVDPVEALRTE